MKADSKMQGAVIDITTAEAARNDYNLSSSRHVTSDHQEPPLPLEEALVLLAQAEEVRREADAELNTLRARLGFTGWRDT
jgi:type I restriction enzyme M protein